MSEWESQGASPAPENSPEPTSSGDVNSEGSEGGSIPKAVPYHRFQKTVWERNELQQRIQDLEARLSERQTTSRVVDTQPDEEAPDEDDDPIGYSRYMAQRAEREAKATKSELQQMREQLEQEKFIQALTREFEEGLGHYPGLNTEDFRGLAWDQFCMGKDRSRGKASAKEILAGLDSQLRGYDEPDTPAARNRQKLRGKPKSKHGETARAKDKEYMPGNPEPKGPAMSHRQRFNHSLKAKQSEIMERLERQARKLSGV